MDADVPYDVRFWRGARSAGKNRNSSRGHTGRARGELLRGHLFRDPRAGAGLPLVGRVLSPARLVRVCEQCHVGAGARRAVSDALRIPRAGGAHAGLLTALQPLVSSGLVAAAAVVARRFAGWLGDARNFVLGTARRLERTVRAQRRATSLVGTFDRLIASGRFATRPGNPLGPHVVRDQRPG